MTDEPNLSTPGGDNLPPGLEPPSPRSKGSNELREFLMRTAELLRLEPKKPDPAVVPAADAKPKKVSAFYRIPLRARVAVVGTVVVVIAVTAMRSAGAVALPAASLGVWRTDAASYARRRFEITDSSLAFQTDDSSAAIVRHGIVKVKASTVPEGTLYQVDYLDQPEDKSPLTFEFILATGENPTIVFANQKKILWRRTGPVTGG